MNLRLMKMVIDNFKGLRHLELQFDGKSASIAGQNGLGKSSIVDAFSWALFGTDSHGNAPGSDNFREKPLGENGEVIHNLTTSVELDFQLDGERFNVKREQSENWVRKRGSSEATFNGNVSAYFINDLPIKQNEFRERINSVANDEIFRLVSSLGAFNALDWKKRRNFLLNLAGNDVDAQLLERDEYRRLADEIGQRNISADDLRKVLTEQRKSINNSLKMLPVRIDEAKKSLPTFKPNEVHDAEYLIEDSKRSIQTVDQQIIDLKSASGTSNRSQILMLEQELVSIKRRMMDEHNAGRRRLQNEADEVSTEYRTTMMTFNNKRREGEDVEKSLNAITAQREEMLQTWNEIKKSPVTVDESCPTCGQPLPPEMVEDARKRLEQGKRDKLKSIQDEGKIIRQKLDQFSEWNEEVKKEVIDLESKLESLKQAKETANKAVMDYPVDPDFSKEPRIAEIESELATLKTEQFQSPNEKIRQLEERKRELQAIIDKNAEIVQRSKSADDIKERISSYERQQQNLGAELNKTELLIGLTEKFIADRCGALEDSINGHFPTIKWKLFSELINGGLIDCCEAMIQCESGLVPISSCNTAAAINADIEIIDVLSEYYDVHVPLFIDNGERVNTIRNIDTQVIVLSVSTDSELKIELID